MVKPPDAWGAACLGTRPPPALGVCPAARVAGLPLGYRLLTHEKIMIICLMIAVSPREQGDPNQVEAGILLPAMRRSNRVSAFAIVTKGGFRTTSLHLP